MTCVSCATFCSSTAPAVSSASPVNPPLHIGLAAGETSGDQLGAALIRRIRERRPDAQFSGIAGPHMRAAGCEAIASTEELSVMGLAEVLNHLPRLLQLRRRVGRCFIRRPPRLFVGIDAPDFNLGLEKRLRQHGIRTLHWVSPSVWAWRRYRVKKLRDSVDSLLVLFPFEADFYRGHGVEAHYVGHPLADEISEDCGRQSAREALALDASAPCIALLPGSRESEVKRLLKVFLQTAQLCQRAEPDLQFVLPTADDDLLAYCQRLIQQPAFAGLNLQLLRGQAHSAMCAADAVLLASGTATLECLLLGRPMVVAYRLHPLSYQLVRRLLQVPHVSLPNILLGRPQVPEYLQSAASPGRLAPALLELLQQPETAARQVAPFAALHRTLSRDSASRAAELVLQRISTE
jgi:lipid-A-disaccharide synthase